MEKETRTWAMILHLSLLAGFVIPMAGLIAPIIIWQIKKEEMPEIDAHGKMATNFIISMIIYSMVCVVLSFFLIGIPLLFALAAIGVIYPIIGGVKANNGELWNYPGVIQLIK